MEPGFHQDLETGKASDNTVKPDNNQSAVVAISMHTDTSKIEIFEKLEEEISHLAHEFSEKTKRAGRFGILVLCVIFLIIGRYSVPNNPVECVQDKVLEALQIMNVYINKNENQYLRDIAQILCSLLVDTTFLITFGYWVLRGNTGRLPVTLAVFYVTRALVQKIWYSPFPDGFYWESPGIPSLVVPYGRGSDFFFSGHSGFMVICALEWHHLQIPKARNFVLFSGAYTIFVLLTYRIHYSIDVFVGVFFAEWCFGKVHRNKELIDGLWMNMIKKLRNLLTKKDWQLVFMGTDIASETPKE